MMVQDGYCMHHQTILLLAVKGKIFTGAYMEFDFWEKDFKNVKHWQTTI